MEYLCNKFRNCQFPVLICLDKEHNKHTHIHAIMTAQVSIFVYTKIEKVMFVAYIAGFNQIWNKQEEKDTGFCSSASLSVLEQYT